MSFHPPGRPDEAQPTSPPQSFEARMTLLGIKLRVGRRLLDLTQHHCLCHPGSAQHFNAPYAGGSFRYLWARVRCRA